MIARCCDCGEHFYRGLDEVWKVRCLDCWFARRDARSTQQRSTRQRPPPTDPLRNELAANLRGLLSLCHPDHHGGSLLSTRVTQWLLDVRKRIST